MMQLKKTSPGKALKALYVVPLVLIGIASNANTVYDVQDVRLVRVTDTLRIQSTGTKDKNMEVRTVVINGIESDTTILKSMPTESISSVTINKEDGDAKVYIVTVTDTLSNRSTGTQDQNKQLQKIIIDGKELDFEKLQSLGGSISSVSINKKEGDGKVQVVTVVGTSSGDLGDSSSESSEQVARIILNGTVDASELGSAARVVADLVKVYVNGENVDASELDTLDPENIKSVEVDKQGEVPVIKVTLKKADKK